MHTDAHGFPTPGQAQFLGEWIVLIECPVSVSIRVYSWLNAFSEFPARAFAASLLPDAGA